MTPDFIDRLCKLVLGGAKPPQRLRAHASH
jgi:hypothetical protein